VGSAAHDEDDDRRSEKDRRSGEDRRKPRSSFVERIGKAINRRSARERRGEDRRSS